MDELELLKQRADTMGVKYSPNIGIDALKQKIEDKLAGSKTSEAAVETGEETHAQIRQRMQMEEMKLVRLRIANLNPDKKDLHGEIFTVANKFLGTVRKFIPYGEATDNGYHVPYVLYKQLKDRKFLQIRVVQQPGGQTEVQQKWVPEFALEILEPLTQEELNRLANKQAAAAGIE